MTNDSQSNGIVQFLYSLILTRGIKNIMNDMDERDCKLMGRHGYCSQEMVNLIIMGEAISNVHDGDISLGGEPGNEKILKGFKTKSKIGQLSLFEHYQNLKVTYICDLNIIGGRAFENSSISHMDCMLRVPLYSFVLYEY